MDFTHSSPEIILSSKIRLNLISFALNALYSLWIVPVGWDPLGHVGVTPHQIPHELLGVDVGGQDVAVLVERRGRWRSVRSELKSVRDDGQC